MIIMGAFGTTSSSLQFVGQIPLALLIRPLYETGWCNLIRDVFSDAKNYEECGNISTCFPFFNVCDTKIKAGEKLHKKYTKKKKDTFSVWKLFILHVKPPQNSQQEPEEGMWSFLGKVFLGHKRWECVLGWAATQSWLSPWVKLSICWSGRACAELYKQSGWIRGQSWGHRLAADPSLISLLSDLYLINTLPSAKVSNTCAEHGAPVWGQPAHVLLLRFNRFKHFNWNSSSKLTDMMLKYAKNKQPKKQKQTPAQLGCLLVSVKGGVTPTPPGTLHISQHADSSALT